MLSRDEAVSVRTGLELLDLIGVRKPIAGARILDLGCGVKIAQALVERGSPQGLYVGLDVYREMVEFMQSALSHDPRYRFEVVDFHNEKYNQTGVRMDEFDGLPIGPLEFDILTMFSVVTHMVPEDTRDALTILRKYAAPDAVLIFSAFVGKAQAEAFVDVIPEKPLFQASFRQDVLEGIIAETGWSIEEHGAPIENLIQDFYVCRPA